MLPTVTGKNEENYNCHSWKCTAANTLNLTDVKIMNAEMEKQERDMRMCLEEIQEDEQNILRLE
jgi:hypothetical protein